MPCGVRAKGGHMQLTEHLDVDADHFFDAIERSIIEDVDRSRGRKTKGLTVRSGLSYKKFNGEKDGRALTTLVDVIEWDPPRAYSSRITDESGETTVSYVVEPDAGGGIDVRYSEEFVNTTGTHSALRKVAGAVELLPAKNQVKRMLHNIEAQIKADDAAARYLSDDGRSPADE